MTDTPPAPKSLSEALSALQAHLPRVAKTADAQYGKYADLTVVSAAVLPLMASLGLSFKTLLTRLPGLRLDPDEPAPFFTGMTFRNPDRIPVTWD